MIDPIVTIVSSVVIAVVIATVLGFAVAPILAVGDVAFDKINNLTIHQRWVDYWIEWEERHT